MELLRSFFSWIFLYLVASLFFITASIYGLFAVINSDNIKQTAKEEGAYKNAVSAVLSSAGGSDPTTTAGQLPLNEPFVKDAADRAFPENDLADNGDQVIDGVFGWLEGKTPEPQYKLDFTANKQNLANEIKDSTEARLKELPRCGSTDVIETIDAFRAGCLPFGVSPSNVADEAAEMINSSESLLGNPVVTSDQLPEEAINQLGALKPFYENKSLLQGLLPALTVLSAGLGILLATNRQKALRRLGVSFIGAAVGLLIFAFIAGFLFDRSVSVASSDALTSDVIAPVLNALSGQFRNVYFVFAGIGAVLGAVTLFIRSRIY